jgi:hypothetical protein
VKRQCPRDSEYKGRAVSLSAFFPLSHSTTPSKGSFSSSDTTSLTSLKARHTSLRLHQTKMRRFIKSVFSLAPLLLLLLLSFATISSAGPCYKVLDHQLAFEGLYQVPPQEGAPPNTWSGQSPDFGGDAFSINFNNQNQLNMNCVIKKGSHAYLYIIMFRYNTGREDWLYLRGGDYCMGMAPGQTVGVPVSISVTRVKGS